MNYFRNRVCAVCLIVLFLTACGESQMPVPTVNPTQTLRWVCTSNVNDERNPLAGRVVRFKIPVDINPNGSVEVLAAIRNYEKMTGGAMVFNIVDEDPEVGISIIEGDALDGNGQPGCGNVTNGRAATSDHEFQVDDEGVFNSLVFVHLGSSGCDHTQVGYKDYSVAEHEIAHALGIGVHFTDFTGNEGLSPSLNAVIVMLYNTLPGTDISDLCFGIN